MFRYYSASDQHKRAKKKLQAQIDKLETEVAKLKKKLEVASVEIDSMAAVIARDRQRVQAESSGYAKARAENEGLDK